MINKIGALPAHLAYKSSVRNEKRLGYKIELNCSNNGWVNGAMLANMTRTWQNYGLNVKGNGYFTIGKITNGVSSRFDHISPYYQAWFGGYMVEFEHDKAWTLEDHYKLALADQKSWLRTYCDPNPHAEVDFSTETHLGKINIEGLSGQLYTGCIESHTDVGKRNDGWMYQQFMNGFAYIYNMCKLAPQLKGENLMPTWTIESPLESFQPITLQGYVALLDVSPMHKAVLYANGCRFTDRYGKKYDTFKQIGDELLDLIKGVSIVTV